MAKTIPHYKPDRAGFYGPRGGQQYGGRYAPEVLIPALEQLESAFGEAKSSKKFQQALQMAYSEYVGRPTPLYYCENLSRHIGGANIYIKNEGLCHTGAHKINHCVGQILLAKAMGKTRIVAETGAGQHGLATSAVCAKYGLKCTVHMGAEDVSRQRPNVFWMQQLGAEVIAVEHGGKRLKDAVNSAIKDWITNVADTHYLLGSCLGPHPFPEINRYFQRIVGKEIRQQCVARFGHLPDYIIACVGGGSNSIGAFDDFLKQDSVNLIGVEAGGKGIRSGKHAARFEGGKVGVVEGYKSYWLLDKDGQVRDTHSVSAGLDYAGVGPLHAYLHDIGRVQYTNASDQKALEAFSLLAKLEGIFPAIESAHGLAEAIRLAPMLPKSKNIVVNLSGRGDKDMFIVARHFGDKTFFEFLKNYAAENIASNKKAAKKIAKKVGKKTVKR